MKIYTSYFAKHGRLPAGVVGVSISRFPPHSLEVASIVSLAPSADLLMGYKYKLVNQEEYTIMYNEQLKELDPQEVLREIERATGGKDAALLCYEKSSDFCHRHLVAKWLNENCETDIAELVL
jgi:uncharacterized protein YeaO (DUF488 family)